MTSKYVVIDGNGSPSWSDKTDSSESFNTFKAAERRAREIAKDQPGPSVGIFERVATVEAEVSAPRTVMVPRTKP